MGEEYAHNGASSFYVEMWEDKEDSEIKAFIEWASPQDVPIRVGFCGAHGVGKAKLARKVANQLDLPLISHVPRTVKGLGLGLNKSADIRTQMAVWLGQVNEQVDLYEFVSDRTLIDYLAYARIMVNESQDPIDEFLLNSISNLTNSLYNSQYTVVFYLPPTDEGIRNNGYRSRDRRYQEEVDEYIRYYLNCFNVDYFPLQGSELMKFKLAMEYLEDSGLLNREE